MPEPIRADTKHMGHGIILYVSRDLFILASLFRFLLYNVDGFQKLQTLVDVFAAVSMGLFAQWFVFFRKQK